MGTEQYWRSGHTDDEGRMRCACGSGGFEIKWFADEVRLTEEGRPYTTLARKRYFCVNCGKVVLPLMEEGDDAVPPEYLPM